MGFFGLIPARGGSKGIKMKNIYHLNSKPLISYTIEAALSSGVLERVFVSTEDNEIASVSEKLGADIILRPEELAEDTTPTVDVALHALDETGMKGPVVVLQPTSPLRTAEDIRNAVEIFKNTPEADSLVSVTDFPHPPFWAMKVKNNRLKPLFGYEYLKMRRQDLEKAYIPNGAIFIGKKEIIEIKRTFYTENTIPYYMPPERSIDIDTQIDMKFAEFLLNEEEKE